jgi:hypothetical protein
MMTLIESAQSWAWATADDVVGVTVIKDTDGTDKVMVTESPNPAGCKP